MEKKGFTLLEILIVIIIIAILATFAIPQYLKASKRAIASEAVTTIGAIRGALARYYQEYNQITSNLAQLDIDNPNDETEVPHANFSYTITEGGINTYSITATGKGGTRAEGITVTYSASDNNINIIYP